MEKRLRTIGLGSRQWLYKVKC